MGAIQVDAGGDIAMSGPMLGGQPDSESPQVDEARLRVGAVEPQDDGHRDSVLHQIEIVASSRVSAPACLFCIA
jgi:hypothetical protein